MAESSSPGSAREEVLTLSTPRSSRTISQTPYDPARQREWTRGIIASFLLIILAGVITASFCVVFKAKDQVNEALFEKILTIVFGPLIALVSAATGFYFGSRSGQS